MENNLYLEPPPHLLDIKLVMQPQVVTRIVMLTVGYRAGYSLTTGGITAFGYEAGYNSTTGGGVHIGYRAGYSQTTGNANVSVGDSALYSNQTNVYNVAIEKGTL